MRKRTLAAARGFTLLEVMIVIVIILAIMAVVTVNLMGGKKRADAGLAQVQLTSIRDALNHFYLEFNRYPTEEEGLAVLWNKSVLSEEDQAKWRMFTAEPIPKDPWGSPWGFRTVPAEEGQDSSFEIWSYGPDKQDGTTDDIKLKKKTTEDDTSGPAPAGPPGPGR
jgi:general secretion pathway protein G